MGADEGCNRTTHPTRRCVGHSGSCRNQLHYTFQPRLQFQRKLLDSGWLREERRQNRRRCIEHGRLAQQTATIAWVVHTTTLQSHPINNGTCLASLRLIYTSTPFVLASDLTTAPEDSEELVAAAKSVSLQLGEGTGSPVTLRGGRFVFDTANESLLWELLPSLLHVSADDTSSWRVRSLLN